MIAIFAFLTLAPIVKGQIISGESVAHDPVYNRYLASDQATGTVWAVDYDGSMTFFASAPPAVKGIMIRNDTAFCAAGTSGLVLFDLENGSEILQISFPGMNNLNDVIGDTSGNVYVSDAQGNKVYKLDLSDLSTELVLDNFDWANGMVFDTVNNRIIICQWISNSPITAINLNDYSTEIVRDDGLYGLDGLAWDVDGNLFVSSQGTGHIYFYDPSFSLPPQAVLYASSGSADIAFNYEDTILAIPNTNSGQLLFVPMRDPDRDLHFEDADNCPQDFNPNQDDADGDNIGDACDECTDTDDDGFGDPEYGANTCDPDYCPDFFDLENADSDGDLIGDSCDNCIGVYNPDQTDNDEDGYGDVCDICGDANGDLSVNIGDVVFIGNHVFRNGECTTNPPIGCAPEPYEAGDVNCDGDVNIGDAVYLGNVIFRPGSPEPCMLCK
jgi:hypothetical protein